MNCERMTGVVANTTKGSVKYQNCWKALARRLVLVFVGVGEDARCEQHGGRDADPGIDHESDEARGPGGIRAEEKDRITSALRDIVVDGTAVCEHELKAEHRDEPGDRIGEDGEKPPEHLSFDAGLIEKERERQPAEVVDARREHRPEDVPAEDLEEGRRTPPRACRSFQSLPSRRGGAARCRRRSW